MAIQVGGTTVISNNRALSSVNGLKTVGGQSILGSGDIAAGGAPWNAEDGTDVQVGSGTTFVSGSANTGRYFIGYFQNGSTAANHFGFQVNGNNSFVQLTGFQTGRFEGNTNSDGPYHANTVVYTANSGHNHSNIDLTGRAYFQTTSQGNNPHFGRAYVRGYVGAGSNISLHKLNNNSNTSAQNCFSKYAYWDE